MQMKTWRSLIYVGYFWILCYPLQLAAQADWSRSYSIENWQIHPDLKHAGLFYYNPGSLQLATLPGGQPDAVFISMRQTGSAATGRANQLHYKSLFQCRIQIQQPDASQLERIQEQLRQQFPTQAVQLIPLPVWKTSAQLVFPAVDGIEKQCTGFLESSDAEGTATFWSERLFTAQLSPTDAQLLEKALSIGQSTLHLQYTFFSKVAAAPPVSELNKTEQTSSEASSTFTQERLIERDSQLSIQPILSDALMLGFDTRKFPGLIRKIDVNSQAPPAYALLEVRCYDFNNALRKDLFGKRIEVEAEGLSGKKVTTSRTFYATQPEVCVQSIRFPFAVKLDRPLRYRVTELSEEKAPIPGAWSVWKNWSALIDISHSN